jgi:RNA polymerase sigma-70 factor (ECF subfamily)
LAHVFDLTGCIAPGLAVGHAARSLFFAVLTAPGGGDAVPPNETDLLARLARGDARALKALFDAHGPQALAVALRILRSPSEAEEVVQDTFVEVWRRGAEYDASRGGPIAWILTIARTRAIDRLRARDSSARTEAQVAAQPAPPRAPSALELVERRQERERVQAALAALPEEQRAALELAYFEGLTHREIADRTQTPLGTVKTRLRLALEKVSLHFHPKEESRS